MTGEQRDQLRGEVIYAMSYMTDGNAEDLLDLIDRQPTDEEAKELWNSLKFSLCSQSTNHKDYFCHKCRASFDWKAEGGGWNGEHKKRCIMSTLQNLLGITVKEAT